MTLRFHPSPAAQCVGKERFASAKLAHEVVKRRRFVGKINVAYRCQFCGGWHLGAPRRPLLSRAERLERSGKPA